MWSAELEFISKLKKIFRTFLFLFRQEVLCYWLKINLDIPNVLSMSTLLSRLRFLIFYIFNVCFISLFFFSCKITIDNILFCGMTSVY